MSAALSVEDFDAAELLPPADKGARLSDIYLRASATLLT